MSTNRLLERLKKKDKSIIYSTQRFDRNPYGQED